MDYNKNYNRVNNEEESTDVLEVIDLMNKVQSNSQKKDFIETLFNNETSKQKKDIKKNENIDTKVKKEKKEKNIDVDIDAKPKKNVKKTLKTNKIPNVKNISINEDLLKNMEFVEENKENQPNSLRVKKEEIVKEEKINIDIPIGDLIEEDSTLVNKELKTVDREIIEEIMNTVNSKIETPEFIKKSQVKAGFAKNEQPNISTESILKMEKIVNEASFKEELIENTKEKNDILISSEEKNDLQELDAIQIESTKFKEDSLIRVEQIKANLDDIKDKTLALKKNIEQNKILAEKLDDFYLTLIENQLELATLSDKDTNLISCELYNLFKTFHDLSNYYLLNAKELTFDYSLNFLDKLYSLNHKLNSAILDSKIDANKLKEYKEMESILDASLKVIEKIN